MGKNILLRSALWVTISEIFFNLSGFIIHSILGRVLGPADYGRYGLVITLTTMVITLIGNGIPTAMSKYISEIFETNPRKVLKIKHQSVTLQVLIIGAITLIFYFSSGLLSMALGDPTLAPLFRFSTLIIPTFAAASFYFSYYTGLHRFNTQATLKTLRSFFRIVFVVGLALFFGLKGSISGYIIAPFAVFLIAYFIDKFKVDKKLKKDIENSDRNQSFDFDWHNLVTYGWQVVVFFLAYELLISIDLYMVKGLLRDDTLTGIYNASLTVGRIPYYIFYAMTIFLLPMVSKASAESLKNAKGLIDNALRLMLILLVPMVFLMSAYSEPTLRLLYGQKYIAGAEPMSVLVFGVGFLTIFYVLSFAMNGAAKTKTAMYVSTFGFLVNALLNYFFIRKMGILGSAYATSIASLVSMLGMLYYIRKDFDAGFNWKEVGKVIFSGLVIYFPALFIPVNKITFLLWSSIFFIVYLIILYFLKGVTKEDIQYFLSLKKNRKKEEVEEELSGNEPEA